MQSKTHTQPSVHVAHTHTHTHTQPSVHVAWLTTLSLSRPPAFLCPSETHSNTPNQLKQELVDYCTFFLSLCLPLPPLSLWRWGSPLFPESRESSQSGFEKDYLPESPPCASFSLPIHGLQDQKDEIKAWNEKHVFQKRISLRGSRLREPRWESGFAQASETAERFRRELQQILNGVTVETATVGSLLGHCRETHDSCMTMSNCTQC